MICSVFVENLSRDCCKTEQKYDQNMEFVTFKDCMCVRCFQHLVAEKVI